MRGLAFAQQGTGLARSRGLPRGSIIPGTTTLSSPRGVVHRAHEGIFFDGSVQEVAAETVIETISFLGGTILVLAAFLAFVNLGLLLANAALQREAFRQFVPFDRQATVTRTRLQVAQLIALGLEVLVCGDLLETLVKSTTEYTFDSLYKLALVATIRTFLSFFLGLETEEILERAKIDRRLDGIAVGPPASNDRKTNGADGDWC